MAFHANRRGDLLLKLAKALTAGNGSVIVTTANSPEATRAGGFPTAVGGVNAVSDEAVHALRLHRVDLNPGRGERLFANHHRLKTAHGLPVT